MLIDCLLFMGYAVLVSVVITLAGAPPWAAAVIGIAAAMYQERR